MIKSLDDHLGSPGEDTVRRYIRRECAAERWAEDVVAVGPWWTREGQDQIDILALAGRDRHPVLAGEVKWARTLDATRLINSLHRKAASITTTPDSLSYLICAREQVRAASADLTTITAADIFTTETA